MTGQKFFNGWVIGLLLLGLGLATTPAQADGGLPDRNPPPATAPGNGGKKGNNPPPGASIELTAWPAGGLSIVQWQDRAGNWHNVDGWCGVLDDAGRIRWWVAAKDFSGGPFRWVVGEAVSPPFNLPGGAGQIVSVSLR